MEGIVLADIKNADAVAEESKKIAVHANFRAVTVQVDVTDEAAVKEMAEIAIKEFGRIDYCVHSAGVSVPFSNLYFGG